MQAEYSKCVSHQWCIYMPCKSLPKTFRARRTLRSEWPWESTRGANRFTFFCTLSLLLWPFYITPSKLMILLITYSLTHTNIHQNLLQETLSAGVIVVHDFVCVIPLNSNTAKSPLEGTVTPRINACWTIQRWITVYMFIYRFTVVKAIQFKGRTYKTISQNIVFYFGYVQHCIGMLCCLSMVKHYSWIWF